MSNTYDELHPHQRNGRNEPVVVDGKGRCLVCSRDLLDELRVQQELLLEDLKIEKQRGDGWRDAVRKHLEQFNVLRIMHAQVVSENIRLREDKEEQLKEANYLREDDA